MQNLTVLGRKTPLKVDFNLNIAGKIFVTRMNIFTQVANKKRIEREEGKENLFTASARNHRPIPFSNTTKHHLLLGVPPSSRTIQYFTNYSFFPSPSSGLPTERTIRDPQTKRSFEDLTLSEMYPIVLKSVKCPRMQSLPLLLILLHRCRPF